MATESGHNFMILKYCLIGLLTLSLIGTIVLLVSTVESLYDSYETINRYELIINHFGALRDDFHDLLRNVPFNPLTKAKQQENTSILLLIIYSISITVEVIGLIGVIKENEILLFISPVIMAFIIVLHFFIGQRPKAMTLLLSFTVTLLAFIFVFMIRKQRREEVTRKRLRNMIDHIILSATIADNNHNQNKPPPSYEQIDLISSIK